MTVCKNCEEKNSIIKITEVDRTGKKTVTYFCNSCGIRSKRIKDITKGDDGK